MLTITKPVLGLLLMAAAAFGQPGGLHLVSALAPLCTASGWVKKPTPPPTQPLTPPPTPLPTTPDRSHLAAVYAAEAVYETALNYMSAGGEDRCYTDPAAAGEDIKELKTKFALYKAAVRETATMRHRSEMRAEYQSKSKTFAAMKRTLRTLQRKAKLDGKSGKKCEWTRSPTPPPTQPPTEEPTPSPTQPPTEPPTPGPTGGPTQAPTGGPTQAPTPAPTQPPTEEPTSPPTQPPTPAGLTYTANQGNFEIDDTYNRQSTEAMIEELQKYTYIAGGLYISNPYFTSIELNLLKGIGTYLYVRNNDQLSTFNANQLQSIGGYLKFKENGQLSTFNANQLQSIGGFVIVQSNGQLSTFNPNQLQSIGGDMYVMYNGQLGTFNANQLQSIGGILQVRSNSQLSTFNANQLESIGGHLQVYKNGQLTTLGLGALKTIGAKGGSGVGLTPGPRLDMYDNQINFCSLTLQSICTSTKPVNGNKCKVGMDCE